MIRSLGSAGLILTTLATGLGLYFVSYTVSQERARIITLERRIAAGSGDIRALEAEMRVRANLPQLEQWNVEVLALKAPKAGQILESEVQLAALVNPNRTPQAAAEVRLASVVLPRSSPDAAEAVTAKSPTVREAPEAGLFTAAFVAEIDAAAAGERASLQKVSLR